jgi:NADPH2:quinone reductase
MTAAVVSRLGGPEVLALAELPEPEPAAGQVLVQVRRASVNFADIMARRSGYLGTTPPFVPGIEVAGTVAALGEGVSQFEPGQRVYAVPPRGGYAQFVAVDAARVFPIPDELDPTTAAAAPFVVSTGYALLHSLGRVQPGDRVLTNAAAGGVGLVVGQLARAAGAHAVGVVSTPEKARVARQHGFAEVVTGGELRAGALAGRLFDLVLDSVGGEDRAQGWALLAPFGTLVAYGNASGAPEEPIEPARLRTGNHRVAGLSVTSLAAEHPDALAAIVTRAIELVADGTVRIEVSEVLPLADAARAHQLVEGRRSTGKIVLAVTEE